MPRMLAPERKYPRLWSPGKIKNWKIVEKLNIDYAMKKMGICKKNEKYPFTAPVRI